MNTEKIFDELQALFNTFSAEAKKNLEGNKAAGVRARKATLTIEKLCKEYRKASVEASNE